jgi:hypothetical protein
MVINKVIRDKSGFWYVGRLLTADPDGVPVFQRLSELYCHKGWALNFARRMCIKLS